MIAASSSGIVIAATTAMTNFDASVNVFMSTPVHTISEFASLREAEDAIRRLGITSLAVVGDDGTCSGILTSTDLIRAGLHSEGESQSSTLLVSDGRRVAQVMTPFVVTVESGCTLADAAEQMLNHHVHRVFVMAASDIVGVLSTRDVMAAIEDARITLPVSLFMSSPVFTVRASEPISLALQRLEKAQVTGLIVVDESEWPVGIFGHEEALDAGSHPRSTPIEKVMDPAVLTLPDHSELHHVARQALAMGTRRVAVMSKFELVGIMTGIDFAKAIVKKPIEPGVMAN